MSKSKIIIYVAIILSYVLFVRLLPDTVNWPRNTLWVVAISWLAISNWIRIRRLDRSNNVHCEKCDCNGCGENVE